MVSLARLLGKFVPNPWAVASREGRATRLRLLADMAGRQLGDADPETMLKILVECAPEDLGLDFCLSYSADVQAGTLTLHYAHGIGDGARDELRQQTIGEGPCGRVAADRAPLVMEGVAWSDDPLAARPRRMGLHAYACFPLLSDGGRGDLLGVLTFGSRRLFRFSDEDVAFFATVASHAAAVHARNRSERAVREREHHFRTLADSIPHLAWMARPDGYVFWYNKRWHDFTGTSAAETEGWDWRSVHHPDHVERVVERFRRSLETGEPWEDTFPLRSRSGSWRWFLSRALPVRDALGRIDLWFGTNTDVTEQREAEAELRRARDEAEQATRSKSKFLAAASHDLRQPVQSMMLLANVLEGQIPEGRPRQTLNHLQRGMDALKDLVDGLLDISRLDAGGVVPEPARVPLGEVFSQMDSVFRPVAAGKELGWHVIPTDIWVESDPKLLARVLRNLLENALRYTPVGEVTLSAEISGGEAVIAVADTGIGIPADQIDTIWDEFHQVGNPERDRCQGTGLGLAIVRRLAGLLNHPISLSSVEGQGSRFEMRVKLAEPAPEALGRETGNLDPARPVAMVVDDDTMVLLGLQAQLDSLGYSVMIAGSGRQALDALDNTTEIPDVIVADYRLRGGESGIQAVASIRRKLGRAEIPGIILTGEAGREVEAAVRKAGLGFINKPVTSRQLRSALDAAAEVAPHHLRTA